VSDALYSASRSFLASAIWRLSTSVKRTLHQRSAARVMAPNMSFRTGRSPQALRMIFGRRRFSTNRLSSRLVVLIVRRWVTGTVEQPGGGDHSKTEEQPHAKRIAHRPEPALQSEDELRYGPKVRRIFTDLTVSENLMVGHQPPRKDAADGIDRPRSAQCEDPVIRQQPSDDGREPFSDLGVPRSIRLDGGKQTFAASGKS
jgi:hypothetical protein